MRARLGTCALCLESGPLRRSHIVPEFVHRGLYDEHHKAVALSARDIAKEWKSQVGIRVHLLCDRCEGFINDEYEKPFEEYWYAGNTEPIRLGALDHLKVIELRVPEPERFLLFHLSVIWRAGAAADLHSQFHLVRLGSHQEQIRKILLKGVPVDSAHPYALVCCAVERPGGSGVFHDLISPPTAARSPLAEMTYGITFGGCCWLYFMPSRRSPELDRVRLQDDGKLYVLKKRWTQLEAFVPDWRASERRRNAGAEDS